MWLHSSKDMKSRFIKNPENFITSYLIQLKSRVQEPETISFSSRTYKAREDHCPRISERIWLLLVLFSKV